MDLESMLAAKLKEKYKSKNFNQTKSTVLRLLCSLAVIFCTLAAIRLPIEKIFPVENLQSKPEITAYFDVSNSISPKLGDRLLSLLSAYAQNFEIKIKPFSDQISAKEINWKENLSFKDIQNLDRDLDLNQSQVDQILNHNKEEIALILSDGQNTSYSEDQTETQNHALFPIVPDNSKDFKNNLEVLSFLAPSLARKNENLKLKLYLQNHSNHKKELKITFYSDTEKIKTITNSLEAGALGNFETDVQFKDQEQSEYRALIESTDASGKLKQQEMRTYTHISIESEILLISSDPKEEHNIAELFKEEGLLVKNLLAPELRNSKFSLKDFSMVVFNNVPKSALADSFIDELIAYVEAGGKFLMLGGNKSFGLGGYKFSAIEEILPVTLVKPQAEEQRLNVAVELLLDKSFSMEDSEKIEFAKLAAREVYKTLKDDDYFGVIGFEDQMFEAIRLTPVRNLRGIAENRISLLFPAGGTQLLPALGTAASRLDLVQAGRKHLIILTDGKLPDGYPNQRYYLELIENLRLAGVTVSCFLIGGESDFLLNEMAKRGGGAYHKTTDASSLPRLFIEDVRRSGKELTKLEGQNFPVRNLNIKDSDLQSFPEVTGFVDTQIKPNAELSLTVSNNQQKSYPLLAYGKHGQGKTAVFTSDLNTRWSRNWYLWTKFKKFIRHFLTKLDLSLEQSENQLDYNLQYQQDVNQFKFLLNIYNQHQESDLEVFLKTGSQASKPLTLIKNGLGAYSFQARVESAGKYELQIKHKDQALNPFIFYANASEFTEQEDLGINVEYLQKLAKETKGKINPKLEELNITANSKPKG
jgi:uncharacterized membrane protein